MWGTGIVQEIHCVSEYLAMHSGAPSLYHRMMTSCQTKKQSFIAACALNTLKENQFRNTLRFFGSLKLLAGAHPPKYTELLFRSLRCE